MANALAITLIDKSKTAVCKETVALCGKYAVTVTPALSGAGKLVLHRKHVLYAPTGRQVENGGMSVAQGADRWDANEVYAVVDLTTASGVTTGTLELRYELLVRDFIAKYGVGTEAPLKFAIYGTDEEGLVGEGEFNVKVVEPYYVTTNQSLVLFKGDKGDTGNAPVITATRFDADGYVIIKADGTEICRLYDGEDGSTPVISATQTSTGCIIKANGTAIATLSNGANGHSPTVTATKIGSQCQIMVDGVLQAIVKDGTNGTDAGVSNAVGVSTQTLAAGSTAAVEVEASGPSSAKQFNFTFKIPRGDKGEQGETGPMGDGSYIYDPADAKWHQVTVWTDPQTGEKTTQVAQTGVDSRPGTMGAHAASHAKNGVDEITPASIGAEPTLTWDSEPVENSTKPVRSGGVFSYVANQVALGKRKVIVDGQYGYYSSASNLPATSKAKDVKTGDYAFVSNASTAGVDTTLSMYEATVSGTAVTWTQRLNVHLSLFTDAQWDAMNSGVDSAHIQKLTGIADGATKVEESTVEDWGFTKNTGTYSKPSTGIPATDLESSVQTTLSAVASKVLNKDTTTLAGIKVVASEPATYEENVLYFIKES